MTETVLKVAGASKRFGGLQALSDVGIEIKKGQVYGLIGPNGAGKTTFFNVITGLYVPDGGTFELGGQPYKPQAVHQVAKTGIARTFQNIRLFAEMTALENVMVGRHVRTHSGLVGAVFRSPGFKKEEAEITGRLEHPGIAPVYAAGLCEDGRPYYVMRFIEGETLASRLARGPLPHEGSRLGSDSIST